VVRRGGALRTPVVAKPKPVAVVGDLCYFLVVNLVWCDAVFQDEQQRFYIFPGLNMSSISGCRAVSLFDTSHIFLISSAFPTFLASISYSLPVNSGGAAPLGLLEGVNNYERMRAVNIRGYLN
jgi:hypothetical protein